MIFANLIESTYSLTISSDETISFWLVEGVNDSNAPRIRRATTTLVLREIKSELSLYSKETKQYQIKNKNKR